MNKFKQTIVSICILFSLISCGKKVTYDNKCGDLKEFEVDEDYCKLYGLNEETFKLKYPSDLEIETQEDYQSTNYVSFFKYDKDSTFIESMNVGFYYGLNDSGGDSMFGSLLGMTKESLSSMMVSQLKSQGFNMQDITMKDEKIRGDNHFTTRGKVETNEAVAGFKGKYIIQFVMIGTGWGHGLLLIMSARDDSGITSFADFETKGCISPILQSID